MDFNVGVLGATGMVGQRFVSLLAGHPWFKVTVVAASAKSAGMTYEEAVESRWAMSAPVPPDVKNLTVLNASDTAAVAAEVDFVFCAVDMSKDETRKLEEAYAILECPVVSNNSAHRSTPDVPMVLPEVNAEHCAVVEHFRKRLGISRGFIAVKPNCSLQSYVPALQPLREYGPERILACTYQAISGAGKTFGTWPDMADNIIPYIAGEEEKSENEPLKLWGTLADGKIIPAEGIGFTTQCIRVPVTDGHLAAVFASFERKPAVEDIIGHWEEYRGVPQKLALPSAPKKLLHYFSQDDRPQVKTERGLEGGMAVSVGRLRPDSQYDVKFVCLSHNTVRGAAGGAILLAELLRAQGYLEPR
ncbi:MAG: aspartate-semialdehyde dehydrogenase [Oscillospiraceae bacterium]|jgi:aspartate-semialdehyde dehydrogenase|nr:aspartate-semialdehyde dehydrogenase [Oscillospiraceae bacterium]